MNVLYYSVKGMYSCNPIAKRQLLDAIAAW